SDAHVSKGKEPVVSDTAAVGTAVATPKRKRADIEKIEIVMKEKKKSDKSSAYGAGASEVIASENVVSTMSAKEKIPKKPRTQKKNAPKVVR
ncbi:hypothetical protein A2U01_0049318, partial [Trifolium medium]|nr:hypothetical protein [Trifolium medium]